MRLLKYSCSPTELGFINVQDALNVPDKLNTLNTCLFLSRYCQLINYSTITLLYYHYTIPVVIELLIFTDELNYSTIKFDAMHFIYYINRSIATKVDSTYLDY